MSAWPEAVWLKQQISNLLALKDIESLLNTLNDKVEDFVDENNFWTSVIPESVFGQNVSYTTTIAGQSTSVILQDMIVENNFSENLDGVTVFLTTDFGQDDVIQASLDNKLIGLLNPEFKNFLQSINYTLKDTKWRINDKPNKSIFSSEQSLNVYFQSYETNYRSIAIANSNSLGYNPITGAITAVYNAITEQWVDQNFQQIYFDSTIIDNLDVSYDTKQQYYDNYKNMDLISWLYYNAQLIENPSFESTNNGVEGE